MYNNFLDAMLTAGITSSLRMAPTTHILFKGQGHTSVANVHNMLSFNNMQSLVRGGKWDQTFMEMQVKLYSNLIFSKILHSKSVHFTSLVLKTSFKDPNLS